MGLGMQQAETKMELHQKDFNMKMERVREQMGRGASQFVVTVSRRLVKKWAFLAPEDTGRLRAGFWPAAKCLGITTVYSRNNHPDQGEGLGVNNSQNTKNPFVIIQNWVPYVANAGGRGTGWWHNGLNQVEAQMLKDLEKVVSGAWEYGEYRG